MITLYKRAIEIRNCKPRKGLVYLADYYTRSKFVCVNITAEGSSVEFLSSPVDQSNVCGFFSTIETKNESVIVGYFANDRIDSQHAPSYELGLYFFVENSLVSNCDGNMSLVFSVGLKARRLEFSSNGNKQASISYDWPIYREFWSKLLGDPSGFISYDFCEEMFKIAKTYK